MKTIHTDSAYRSRSNKKIEEAKSNMSLDESISDSDSDDEDQFNNLTAEVNLIYASFRLLLQFKLFHVKLKIMDTGFVMQKYLWYSVGPLWSAILSS